MASERLIPQPDASGTLIHLERGFGPQTVVALIAEQAARFPQALAVRSASGELSFAELVSAADLLAQRLRALGAGPGSDSERPVALYLPSSTHLVVAALASWKAGAPYLPLDVTSPAERTRFMLQDSGAAVVVSLREHAEAIPQGFWTTILVDEEKWDGEDLPVAAVDPFPDDLAYLIYTSGSTGKPKGVEIMHGNLQHLVAWHTQAFSVTAQDRAAQVAGTAFDAAVWELWPHLASGASIHIPPACTRHSAGLLRDWLLKENVSISFVPTVLAEELLQLSWPASSGLRFLLTGGDALHTYPPAGLPFVLVNNYGPTEATVVATSGVVAPTNDPRISPAIGHPILNTDIHLLDEEGAPVGDGEVGEIVITGSSVGRGYRSRPAETAAKFVVLEIDGRAQRAFRTGDLATRLHDGQLAFAGRADEQIKIRGYRVEPDEIAHCLNQHPGIVTSAVIGHGAGSEKQLIAYLVLRENESIREAELRDFLLPKLPDYMIPTTFAVVSHLPVTANGKLDKDALPEANEENRLAHASYEAPQNEVEELVEGMLSSILAVSPIGLDDNFFLMGGHSLMGAQLIARVRDAFGAELTLRDVFRNPTVRSLSAVIEGMLTQQLEAMTDEEVLAQLEAQRGSQPTSIARSSEG